MKTTINCIILDDEPLAVELLGDYASKLHILNVLYAGMDVFKAIDILNQQTVELIFIDLQMPQLTGMEIMEMFNEKHNFVITSAYPEHALDAFQFHVVDFLVKPITFQHFYQSVKKYQEWKNILPAKNKRDSILIKADGKHHRIATSTIFYIEGMRDYIKIYHDENRLVTLMTMKEILNELPKTEFIRIHRSYIVSKQHIKAIEGSRIEMSDGKHLSIGETYREIVRGELGV